MTSQVRECQAEGITEMNAHQFPACGGCWACVRCNPDHDCEACYKVKTDEESKKDKREEIGDRLSYAREAAGLSQSQAGSLLGLSQTIVSSIEHGERSVKAEELEKFCDAYDVSLDWIVGRQTEADLPEEYVKLVEKLKPSERGKLLKLLAMVYERER